MLRILLKIRLHIIVLSRLMMTLTLAIESRGSGIGKAWDVSPSLQPNSHRVSWPRLDASPLEVRTISGVGRFPHQIKVDFDTKTELEDTDSHYKPQIKRTDVTEGNEIDFERQQRNFSPLFSSLDSSKLEELLPDEDKLEYSIFTEAEPRVRRDTEQKMEKIAASKSVREARLNSPESWSKSQPISVEFRHRTPLDQIHPDEQDIPISSRRTHLPQTDFVTSNRGYFADRRESREMPIARTYDDYDVPIYPAPARDYDIPYSRGYYYPNRYRNERDYPFREEPLPPMRPYDRYPVNSYESYERNRTPAKPKRIIYYATLPEIVRKPDMTNYPRPYDGPTRIPPDALVSRNSLGGQKHNSREYSRPFFRYPYDNYDYDGYKRPGFYDRTAPYHKENGYRNTPDRDLAPTHKENLRKDGEVGNNSQERKTRDNQDIPWPVQIGTEVNVKENERIPGRKVFGQLQTFDRFESAPLRLAPIEAEKPADHSI